MPTKAVVVLNGELVKGTLWFDQEVIILVLAKSVLRARKTLF